MANPPLSREAAELTLAALQEAAKDGYPLDGAGGQCNVGARVIAAQRLGISPVTLHKRLHRIQALYGLTPDPSWGRRPTFVLPAHIQARTTEDLIDALATEHRKKTTESRDAMPVHVQMDGPIGIAFFGDPHVDDPGCAWGDLRDDVEACQRAEGMFAVNIGDSRNNWVGRLMGLYAEQTTTASQGLQLIQWLMTSLPWLLWDAGNHGRWGDVHGNAEEIMHRLLNIPGLFAAEAARMRLLLPAGQEVMVHVRHDFPGASQFNPAHALVRQTLFNYRDHIMACGHRHQSGYMPIWHNDPERLCHGIRVGTYKDFDKYADEKGFKHENWARGMVAIIEPDKAGNPVEFITVKFSIKADAEILDLLRARLARG